MPNPNPKTEQLELGRGKRPTLNNDTVSMRMSQATRESLERIAASFDCFYGGKPWIAGLLEKIGSGQLTVVSTPPYLLEDSYITPDPKPAMRERILKKCYPSKG